MIQFIRSLLFAIGPLGLAIVLASEGFAAEQPNVLFIAIDDLNDWVGCLQGHPQVKTPHIDALARRGMLFTNAHCQAPLCNPSRTSVLTGLRPSTTGIYGLSPWFRSVDALKNRVTLPQHFAAHGYATLSTGKFHHDGYPPAKERLKEFTVWGHAGGYSNLPPKKFINTPSNIRLMDWGVFPERDDEQDDFRVADWAIEQLKNLPKQPFMLCVGLRHPHVPCYASQRWFDLYPPDSLIMPPVKENDRDDVPPFAWYLHWQLPEPRLSWLVKNDQWKPLVRAYLASISFVDSQVGRVMAALRDSGLEESTVVVLWSDHGWHLGEKGITGKNSLWERSTRVPLVFVGPGVGRGKCAEPVELLDLFPTLCDLASLRQAEGLEGHSLLPQLKDAKAPRQWPAITTHNQGNHAVRSKHFRYIHYADGSEELYDHRRDPHEWTNLASLAEHEATLAQHRRHLPRVDSPPVPGSASRILTHENGAWHWEGKPIRENEREE